MYCKDKTEYIVMHVYTVHLSQIYYFFFAFLKVPKFLRNANNKA
jgi:hypothetical protein